ncbi:MAG: hypothetical protein ABEI53_01020 [Candidatus Magasanikbacteria bacterium]
MAVDWSTFGQDYNAFNGNDVRESTRYLAFEVWGRKQLGPVTLTGKAWYSHGMGERTLQGVFVMPKASIPVELGSFTFTSSISPFGIKFSDDNEGLFFYGSVAVSKENVPIALSATWVEPVQTKIPFLSQFAFGTTYTF